jgi:GH24 family phage-related lysozyme (muramidase)
LSVIDEGNLVTTVIRHDTELSQIKLRHDREDDEEHRRDKWRSDMMKLVWGIAILVAGELIVKFLLWVIPFVHIGK